MLNKLILVSNTGEVKVFGFTNHRNKEKTDALIKAIMPFLCGGNVDKTLFVRELTGGGLRESHNQVLSLSDK